VLGRQVDALAAVETWADLERWADTVVAIMEAHGSRGGCPIGTLAAALADIDETSRTLLSAAFERWREAISGALTTLRDNGVLAGDADIGALTTNVLAAMQGGLLLAKTNRNAGDLRTALDGALAQVRAHAPAS
jgi:TetR/AcrR family transcriptional repressor of nem operon